MVDCRDFGPAGLGDLYGQRTDAAAGAIDQDLLTGCDLPFPPETLNSQHPRVGEGRSFYEAQRGGLGKKACSRAHTYSAKAPNPAPNSSAQTSSPG